MTGKIQAPYPLMHTTTLLHDPEFSDSEAMLDEVIQKRSMNGSLYTYVKTKGGRRKLIMQFELDRMKGLELRAFLRSYFRSKIRLTDHLDQVWVGYFTSNPFDFDTPMRQSITLEFEGTLQ